MRKRPLSMSLRELKRTHTCGELRQDHIDQEVVLFGWVHNRRDHGGCIFIDLRDRSGLVQLVFHPEESPDAHAVGRRLRVRSGLPEDEQAAEVLRAWRVSTRDGES